MRKRTLLRRVFLSAAVAFFYVTTVAVSPAHAYVDPGSGSYIIQLVVGGVLGAAFAVKVLWRRLKARVAALRSRSG